MTSTIVLAVLLAATASVQEPAKGRLCIAEKKTVLTDGTCRDVKGAVFEVAPVERERLFLWTSADGKNAQIGTIAAKANNVTLESDARRELKVAIRGQASRGWPAETKVSFRTPADAWRWAIPARAISRLEKIALPAGQYTVDLLAEHHVPLRRRANVTEKITDAGEYRLDPAVQVRGKVVNAEDKPVVGTVSLPDATFCASTDEQGAFVCELPERAELIALSAAGYGTREIKVNRSGGAGGNVDVGTIRMSKGHALTVKVIRDPVDQRPIKLTLFSDLPTEYDHSRLKTKELAAGEDTVRFEDLSAGRYLVVAAGSEPLERLTVATVLKEGEDGNAEVKIEPFRLDGSVVYGDEPISEGTIEVIEREHGWRESVPLRPDGTFGGAMWQKGVVSTFVGPEGMRELVSSPTLGTDPSVWTIRIVKREITGRILDAESKQSVEKASIHLVSEWRSGGRMMMTVPVHPDASFAVLASRTGKYEFTVQAPGYMTKVVEVQIADEDSSKTADVALERGVAQPLEFISPSGTPISRVMILEGVKNDRVNPEVMSFSEGNRITLRGRSGDTRLLYFVPRDGSFAIRRILIPREADANPLQIVIPPAAGSLRIRSVDPDDEPTPAGILLRYGGEFVPPAILRFITGGTLHTGPNAEGVFNRLPAGSYEVWALGRGDDELQLIGSNGTLRQPAQVGLSAGEVSVTVRVPKR